MCPQNGNSPSDGPQAEPSSISDPATPQKTVVDKPRDAFAVHQMANPADIVAEGPLADPRLEPQSILIGQQLRPVTRTAQGEQRLLDTPKMTAQQSGQGKKFLRPLPSDR